MEPDDFLKNEKLINQIVESCRLGKIWELRSLLSTISKEEQGPLLNQYDSFGATALGAAASSGHYEITQYLLLFPGLDLNKGSRTNNFTPLTLAAANGKKRIVELLLSNSKVDKEIKDTNGYTADQEAIYSNEISTAAMIRAK